MTKVQSKKLIAQSLRNWRNKFGYTQEYVACDLDIKTATYQAYEEARAEPSIMILKQLANLYELKSIEQLINLNSLLSKV